MEEKLLSLLIIHIFFVRVAINVIESFCWLDRVLIRINGSFVRTWEPEKLIKNCADYCGYCTSLSVLRNEIFYWSNISLCIFVWNVKDTCNPLICKRIRDSYTYYFVIEPSRNNWSSVFIRAYCYIWITKF